MVDPGLRTAQRLGGSGRLAAATVVATRGAEGPFAVELVGGATVVVEVPKPAASFAAKARAAGWDVVVTTAEAPEVDVESGEVKRRFTLEADTREESDGKSVRVYGDQKRIQTAVVRCRRGTDRLTAVWKRDPGHAKPAWAFDVAVRPLQELTSTQALEHVQHSHTRPCRWLPAVLRGRRVEVCQHHAEVR